MESKIYPSKKSKDVKSGYPLLPYRFKKIGIVVAAASFIVPLILASMKIEFVRNNRELFKTLEDAFLHLGLLFIAWSKEKIEDEMKIYLRLKSLAITFYLTVFFNVVLPIFRLIEGRPVRQVSPQDVITFMLVFFIIEYYIISKNALK